jgi:hypothetical protein
LPAGFIQGPESRSGTVFLLVLAAYFLLQIIIRVSLPESLELG